MGLPKLKEAGTKLSTTSLRASAGRNFKSGRLCSVAREASLMGCVRQGGPFHAVVDLSIDEELQDGLFGPPDFGGIFFRRQDLVYDETESELFSALYRTDQVSL